jgi:hypothetical protein
MKQSDVSPTASVQRRESEPDARIALYEHLLAERDSRISELTTALNHERGKQRSGIWPDLRAGFIGYLLGLPLGLVKPLAAQAFITHTASMMVFSFLVIYFSSAAALVFFMGRKVYRNWKAARQVGPEASYAVQFFYSVVLSFAITMEIITGPHDSDRNLAGATWVLVASLGAADYNYWRMRVHTKRAGKPLPGLPQIGSWLHLN